MTWGSQHDWPRAIVHVDGDAFFAACEQAMHPEYRGKPVVTGRERGIVSAASYEAKARGVSRGVALKDVLKLCPDAIILPSDYETYSLFSMRMFAIMRRTTPFVEEYSIDEGFADITGLRGPMHASYETIAQTMQEAIIRELGISVSVGLSVSKVLAKLGSRWKKPHGFTAIALRDAPTYCAKTPLDTVWGIGPQTTAYAAQLGIRTAGDFIARDESFVHAHFAKPMVDLWQELRGQSVFPIISNAKETYASISKTRTFTPPSHDPTFIFAQLAKNLENACIKARRHGLVTRQLTAFLKTQTFETVTLEATLDRASAYPYEFMDVLRALFDSLFRPRTDYRATGVVLSNLTHDRTIQRSLFDAPLAIEKLQRVYAAVDTLDAQFGKHTVMLASTLPAECAAQHQTSRGALPIRKRERVIGETKRKHLNIPLTLGMVH